MDKSIVTTVRKIAILRTNQGLGDLLVCLPAFRALHAAYPIAEIVLVGLPWHRSFLQHRSTGVDRVLVAPPSLRLTHTRHSPDDAEEALFFDRIQAENFDIFINFQAEEVLSSIILRRARARVTVGQVIGHRQIYDRHVPFFYYQHEVLRYLNLVRLLGAQAQDIVPSLPLLPQEVAEAEALLRQLDVHQPFIIIHPGATDLRRRWSARRFAFVADQLAEQGYTILLVGGESDEHSIMDVQKHMHADPILLYINLSLGALAGVQRQSQLVISNDTGPLHLARAVGCRTIGLYWAPNVINWGPLLQDRHAPLIAWELHCPRCGIIPNNPYPFEPKERGCEHLFSFVEGITTQEVLETAAVLLA